MSFFSDNKREEQLRQVLHSWMGTPYRYFAGVKGAGADCICFVTSVLEEIGFGPLKIEKYPRDWHLHNTEELLFDGIIDALDVDIIDLKAPESGDIILFQFGKTMSHCGFYMDKKIFHAVNGCGVISSEWLDTTWHKRKKRGVRLR